ncbi:MAG: hypothetical protein AB7G47_02025 [Mycolicibacterium sp.]|uniref:aspartate racemase/maleate isomerase family protein n=1 Tax=Mycolicibacterium sp. TaxID=2320850 RepID=UPI003D116A9E
MNAPPNPIVELAWLGEDCRRVGVVVPPSNPVVEPELDALVGDDILIYGARLPRYVGLTLEERNRRYVRAYAHALDGLYGLDVVCALVAMTGPNYRLGVEGDRDLCADLTSKFKAPVRTASLAIHDALTALGLNRIHLLSPYPDWLTDETLSYWSGGGMNVVAVDHLLGQDEPFNAYETRTEEVVAHLRATRPEPGSAVLLTGTGLVSIASIYQVSYEQSVPILSSNLCGAWWILQQCGQSPGSQLYRQIAPAHVPTDISGSPARTSQP